MLLVPLNLADSAAIVDTAKGTVRYVGVGHYPYGAAILPGKKFGLVSNEAPGTVSVVDLAGGKVVKTIQAGAHLSHPEAIALDTKRHRAFVAIANSDQVSVIDTDSFQVEQTLSVARAEGVGSSPTALAVGHGKLLVAESGAESLAVFGLDRLRFVGRIPTAEYPSAVAVTSKRLIWLSAKGLGTGPNTNGPDPQSPNDSDNAITAFQSLPLLNVGAVGIADFPRDKLIRGKLTRRAG